MFPITEVICASKMHEYVFPTISMDTIGSSVYSRTPLKDELAASLKAVLMASTEVSSLTLNVMSVSEPLITGTLMPHPPIFSENSEKFWSALSLRQ